MLLLVLVSLLWAFSFGLIKGKLVGLDTAFISAARLCLALFVFLPFLRLRDLSAGNTGKLFGIGAVQFGVMYLAYNASFRFLSAYEVALFTITTPIFVTLFADLLDHTLRPRALLAALLAVAGTALAFDHSRELKLTFAGLALVQLSNAAFAIGQVWYQRLRREEPALRDREVFALLYAGGFFIAANAMLFSWNSGSPRPTPIQWATLAYLGVLASGVGFFLWNLGATRVSVGKLAVMNNAKIPLGVAVSLLVFGERAPLLPLVLSLAVLGFAVWLAEKKPVAK
jgi:drug/metabolite transporter (DMT)-like permease